MCLCCNQGDRCCRQTSFFLITFSLNKHISQDNLQLTLTPPHTHTERHVELLNVLMLLQCTFTINASYTSNTTDYCGVLSYTSRTTWDFQ